MPRNVRHTLCRDTPSAAAITPLGQFEDLAGIDIRGAGYLLNELERTYELLCSKQKRIRLELAATFHNMA
jgi:hypothetical protein